VVFNYNDMWNDTMRMLKSAFANFYMCPLENAMLPKEAPQKTAKIIEICAKYDKFGEFMPYAYPIRLDGSEVIEIK
ncbi:MAG: hypothetical protein RSB09_04425, partial [Clostridia bacterium]